MALAFIQLYKEVSKTCPKLKSQRLKGSVQNGDNARRDGCMSLQKGIKHCLTSINFYNVFKGYWQMPIFLFSLKSLANPNRKQCSSVNQSTVNI